VVKVVFIASLSHSGSTLLDLMLNAHPEVAHNYERTHALNMWFVISADRAERISEVAEIIEAETGIKVYQMPKAREFYVGFRVEV